MTPLAARPRHPLPWLFLAAATLLSGCVDPYHDPRLGAQEVPADFALVFNVQNPAPSDDPLRQSSQYVLTPDRSLRVALGAGTSEDYFPRLTRQITPDEYAAVSRLALVPAPGVSLAPGAAAVPAPAPGVPSAGRVLYRLEITANGHLQTALTTPENSPAAADLLRLLVRLRGGRPAPATQP